MTSTNLSKIQRAINALKKECLPRNVKSSLIGDYADFLQEKEKLQSLYSFNLSVFNSLVKLANEIWCSKERLKRYELLITIERYLRKGSDKLDDTAKMNLFHLMKKIFENDVSNNSANICISMLRGFYFSTEYEVWLCEKAEHYPELIHRIITYPIASSVITKWVSENFNREEFRQQRYKALSWLINENLDYIIDNQILIDDFEYVNEIDTNRMLIWLEDESFTFVDSRYRASGMRHDEKLHNCLASRPYCSVICSGLSAGDIPDFTPLRNYFTENLSDIKSQTMLWAVAYSKLPSNIKYKLLKRYYSPACFYTLLNIAKRYKFLHILEWLKKQPASTSIFCEIEIGRRGINYF